MSKFKKCYADYCDRIATKKIRVYHIGDDKLVDARRIKIVAHGGTEWRKERKHTRVDVCNICYETAEPSDFSFAESMWNESRVRKGVKLERL